MLWLIMVMMVRAGEEYPTMPDAANQIAPVDLTYFYF
jgi:hypothetical protein